MTRINESNYQSFLESYLDDSLPPEVVLEMENFLAGNPDLLITLEPEHMLKAPEATIDKDSLLVPISSMQLFDLVEGNLLPEKERQLLNKIRNTPAHRDYELLKNARLEADPAIVFEEKSSLLRKGTRVISISPLRRKILTIAASAAAVVLIILYLFPGDTTDLPRQTVYVESQKGNSKPEADRKEESVPQQVETVSESNSEVLHTIRVQEKEKEQGPVKLAVNALEPQQKILVPEYQAELVIPESIAKNQLEGIEVEVTPVKQEFKTPIELFRDELAMRVDASTGAFSSIRNVSAGRVELEIQPKKDKRAFHLRLGQFEVSRGMQ